jgi:serine/threonine protein kinase
MCSLRLLRIRLLIPSRYIVVDLMNGGDLRFHISRKTFTEEAVRFWIAELGCALRYIHKQGIVHRDVKPDNVLLDSDGHVHLADFVRYCQLISSRSGFNVTNSFLLECCVRLESRETSDEQVWDFGVPST